MLTFRAATMDDAARLYAWRDDPTTRAASKNQRPVSFREHYDWLRGVLQTDVTRLFLVWHQHQSVWVGSCRLDRKGRGVEISLTVDPRQRGKGYASQILQRAMVIATDLHAEKLTATVRQDNHASLRAFWERGFRPTKFGELLELELSLASIAGSPDTTTASTSIGEA